MKMCVGAVSRLVVEEAAQLGMTIVASRRQVDIGGGYIGLDQKGFTDLVHAWPNALAVRDHGGPRQGGKSDDGIESLDADVEAGFDRLHIDVCQVGNDADTLHKLVRRYASNSTCLLEIGDEHATSPDVNHKLIDTALDAAGSETIAFGVITTGSFVWADSQIGVPVPLDELYASSTIYRGDGVKTKAHNMDWLGSRKRPEYQDCIDEYNLAPEIGAVEIDALLFALPGPTVSTILHYAYTSEAWTRWFDEHEGTWLQRAKCALRYLRNNDFVKQQIDGPYTEGVDLFVRKQVRDALIVG